MADEQITIEIDGQQVKASAGQMLIEVTDSIDNYVPRFCYHKKLTVAANCRMCLVEVEKAPKPLPACATPVMAGMKVKTRSALALEAQKSVMEFLLINHPLDCPICDQGGECELQDLAMGYGADLSRYQEGKRVVKDKNIGPLVQTDMTRCIHCTRCVRFGEEIAGLRELGATGRGEFMEIGTYIEKSMTSELSGNVIDLCPVGALTAKPFRFSARAWEMSQHPGIAIHDTVGSNLYFHVRDGRVKRIVPAENEAINEVWLSDRDRFSYEGMYSDARLAAPMIKTDGQWRQVAWDTAFVHIGEQLGAVIEQDGIDKVGALISANSTTEELYLLQKLMRGLGTNNIDHRLRQADFSDQDSAPAWPGLGDGLSDGLGDEPGAGLAVLEDLEAVLIIGGYVRKDQPLINLRLRKAALKGAAIMTINPVADAYNYELYAQVSAADMVGALAGVIKAAEQQSGQDAGAGGLLAGIRPDETHERIASALLKVKQGGEKGTVLLGNLAMSHPQLSLLRYLAGRLAGLTGVRLGYLGEAANVVGAWQAGAVPHRLCGGKPASIDGLDAHQMLAQPLSAYLLVNFDPLLDCLDAHLALTALAAARCVVVISPYQHPACLEHADVMLPSALYAENSGSMSTISGIDQQVDAITPPPGEARPGWKILRVLANTLAVEGFDFSRIAQIQAEFTRQLADNRAATVRDARHAADCHAGPLADSLPMQRTGLQRAGYVPMNSVDALVRHAPALQATADVATAAVQINARTAERLGLADNDQVTARQNEQQRVLRLIINDLVADECVLLHGAHPETAALGPLCGEITLAGVG